MSRKFIAITQNLNRDTQKSLVHLSLQLPDNIDSSQQLELEDDFRRKMTLFALFFMKTLDRGVNSSGIIFNVNVDSILMTIGFNVRKRGQDVYIQVKRDLMNYVQAYCNSMSYVWFIDGELHRPDASRRDQAIALLNRYRQ